ncbi:MAG: (2Fe-2S)-binding protein [Holophagaceae bacterium]|jgi:aerobic-type carbon monoxide dehydrogenase small subunit (CoxS/CutS family)
MIDLNLNEKIIKVDAPGEMPLLWVLRDVLGMTGTKFGCGVGVCATCTILENGQAVMACQVTLEKSKGNRYTTIEGLSVSGDHPVQKAWVQCDVAQCGYCQPGMILEACSLLSQDSRPSESAINKAFSNHICRCGTYPRIKQAMSLLTNSGEKE